MAAFGRLKLADTAGGLIGEIHIHSGSMRSKEHVKELCRPSSRGSRVNLETDPVQQGTPIAEKPAVCAVAAGQPKADSRDSSEYASPSLAPVPSGEPICFP